MCAGVQPLLLQQKPQVPRLSAMASQTATDTVIPSADQDFYKYGLKPVLGQGRMESALERLGTVHIKTMEKSNFVKPQSVMYELDGMRCPSPLLRHVASSFICQRLASKRPDSRSVVYACVTQAWHVGVPLASHAYRFLHDQYQG